MTSRRRARFVSDVDRRLIKKGLDPSWKDRVTREDRIVGLSAPDPEDTAAPEIDSGASDIEATKTDEVLLENVPPHWQPRI